MADWDAYAPVFKGREIDKLDINVLAAVLGFSRPLDTPEPSTGVLAASSDGDRHDNEIRRRA